MKNKDKGRKWIWWFLGSLAALQIYFVQELVAALALFALAFAAMAIVITGLYLLQRSWATAVVRVANSRHPAIAVVRQGVHAMEDVARRPFRRPGSEAAR